MIFRINQLLGLSAFCLLISAVVTAQSARSQSVVTHLNTAASSHSGSEAGSEASWADGFPVGIGTSVHTPFATYYMPASSPNPAYTVKKKAARAQAHEVKILVKNYSWPLQSRSAAIPMEQTRPQPEKKPQEGVMLGQHTGSITK